MIVRLAAAVAAWALGAVVAGADGGETIAAIVAENSQPVTFERGVLGGPGADLLLDESSRVSFLLIGESHLNAETPAFVRAMLPALAEAGYTALAIETGERIAAHAEREIAEGRADRFARLMAEVPFTAAFVDHEPELAARRGREGGDQGRVVPRAARVHAAEPA